jgi:hypothetical protein
MKPQTRINAVYALSSARGSPDNRKRLTIHDLPGWAIARQTAGHLTVEVQSDGSDVNREAAAGD